MTSPTEYIVDGNECMYELRAYYARSRLLGNAEHLLVMASGQLPRCDTELKNRIMPDWLKIDAEVAEAMSYLEKYLTIEPYGKSTTLDDVATMSAEDYKP